MVKLIICATRPDESKFVDLDKCISFMAEENPVI